MDDTSALVRLSADAAELHGRIKKRYIERLLGGDDSAATQVLVAADDVLQIARDALATVRRLVAAADGQNGES